MPGGSHSPYHGLATLKSLTEKYHFVLLPHVSVCLSVLSVGVGERLSDHTESSPHFRAISHSPQLATQPSQTALVGRLGKSFFLSLSFLPPFLGASGWPGPS